MAKKKKSNTRNIKKGNRRETSPPVNPFLYQISVFLRKHRVALASLTLFTILITISMLVYTRMAANGMLEPYCTLNANIAGSFLRLFIHDLTIDGATISSAGFSILIGDVCTGIIPMIILTSAILAYPSKIYPKLKAIAFGIITLMIVNLVRLITLFLIGIYAPGIFETAHYVIWQSLMILIAIGIWLFWIWRDWAMSMFLQDRFMHFIAKATVSLILLAVIWYFIGPSYNQLLVLISGVLAPAEVELAARENIIYVYTFAGSETIGGIYISALHYGLLLMIALIAATSGLSLAKRLRSTCIAVILIFGIHIITLLLFVNSIAGNLSTLSLQSPLLVIMTILGCDLLPVVIWAIIYYRKVLDGDSIKTEKTAHQTDLEFYPAKK